MKYYGKRTKDARSGGQVGFTHWLPDRHRAIDQRTHTGRTVPDMSRISEWIHAQGSAGATANAALACQERHDDEDALENRLAGLIPPAQTQPATAASRSIDARASRPARTTSTRGRRQGRSSRRRRNGGRRRRT